MRCRRRHPITQLIGGERCWPVPRWRQFARPVGQSRSTAGARHADGGSANGRAYDCTRGLGTQPGKQPSPCDDCVCRRQCAAEYVACDAYAAYEGGESARVWRDAPRIPLQSIARKLVVKWHGESTARRIFEAAPPRRVRRRSKASLVRLDRGYRFGAVRAGSGWFAEGLLCRSVTPCGAWPLRVLAGR